ncbi:hypothetical protein E2C01_042534 [Portunus trituberculatus]|uniref:Uncharacterized protein n=1 Tax=Portunus trituberculatus TaxID=210409 RepID=A0A5B7FMN7_PORTR|nr:hypothetical protein [Portunus trituberculatus]
MKTETRHGTQDPKIALNSCSFNWRCGAVFQKTFLSSEGCAGRIVPPVGAGYTPNVSPGSERVQTRCSAAEGRRLLQDHARACRPPSAPRYRCTASLFPVQSGVYFSSMLQTFPDSCRGSTPDAPTLTATATATPDHGYTKSPAMATLTAPSWVS